MILLCDNYAITMLFLADREMTRPLLPLFPITFYASHHLRILRIVRF